MKTKSDPTSDEPSTDAVEATAAEAVLTDYREFESVEGQQHKLSSSMHGIIMLNNHWVGWQTGTWLGNR